MKSGKVINFFSLKEADPSFNSVCLRFNNKEAVLYMISASTMILELSHQCGRELFINTLQLTILNINIMSYFCKASTRLQSEAMSASIDGKSVRANLVIYNHER